MGCFKILKGYHLLSLSKYEYFDDVIIFFKRKINLTQRHVRFTGLLRSTQLGLPSHIL